MENLKKAIESRRSYYSISAASPIGDDEIKSLIDHAVTYVPSAFNSQSARLVLLLGGHHRKLWGLVKQALHEKVGPDALGRAKGKIESCFEAGYGTVLFFEDTRVVEGLRESFPTYSDNFPVWSEHTSAMHQYAVWMLLEQAGFGASLQHYNPLIDEYVAEEWGLSPEWRLRAQMPFGVPVEGPGPKEILPLEGRSLIFR